MSQPPLPQFLVVGIGASAGGLEALQTFFAHVPADSGCAYVVVLHRSPEYDSHLAALLQAVAPIPVILVTERLRVEPDHAYVVPPNQHLTMTEGELHVSPNVEPEDRRAPVDIFFRTLAGSHDDRGVCVILSGSGSDGSMGLKLVKECGGVVFVQHPREAAFAEMPQTAIATGMVDDVLPAAEIPARIVAYQASLGTVSLAQEPEHRPEAQQEALREVFTLLRTRTGHDFSNYRRPTLLRRIERRITVHNLPDLPAYAAFLRDHPDETQALLKDLLISVTTFFRDTATFAALEQEIIPRLFVGKGRHDTVRVWVVGCATGEEAYSVAMLCAERVMNQLDAPKVQVFATDIDEAAIAHARAGLYTSADTADVSPERLRRFFVAENQRYRVRPELRDLVLFATHNMLFDPPFAHIDLASCRNLLIYLNQTAQERVIELLHFALNPGGFLFLGNVESTDGAHNLFEPVSREHRLLQRRPFHSRPPVVPLGEPAPRTPALRSPARAALDTRSGEQARERLTYGVLHQQLLEQYAPPSVVVNEAFDIVHLSERAGRYLQLTGGAPSVSLLDVARPELRAELRSALSLALQSQSNVDTTPVPTRIDERTERVTVRVRPALRPDHPAHGLLLVLFDTDAPPQSDTAPVVRAEPVGPQLLEAEIAHLTWQLRLSSEQYEYQGEELRAISEEQRALVEELRASSEELETSKEELQSINEELRTLNQELKVKVEEALQTGADLQNLINATDIATIFLDRQLRIKRFTPAARALFNLIAPDQGRPLADLTHHLCDINVLAEAARVLTTLQSVEHEVRDVNGRAYILRVLPYRAADDRIGGVVLTLFDITERTRIERALAEQARLLDLSNDAIIVRDVGNRILYWNHGATELYGWSREEAIGQDLHTLLQTEFEAPFAQLIAALHTHDRMEGEVVQSTRDSRRITALCRWSLYRDAEGQPGAILTTYNDITARKRAEDTLRASEARFRTLADTVPQIIWTNDPDGRATYFNQRWFAYSGRSQEELLGLGWQAIVHPDDEPGSVERWRQALAANEVFEIEYRLRRADGTYRWHLGRNVPLHDDSGEVIGWFGSATDIEALKQAETAVQHARDELEQRVAERTAELRHLSSTRQELLERLVSAQEDERRHIARELHDSLGQYLSALVLELVRVQTATGTPPDVQTSLARLQRVAREIDAELDTLTMELRPPALDDLGLDEALRRYAQEWSVTGGIPVELIANGFGADRLPLAVETTGYRVVQEALTNVRKHAQARQVSLILERRPGELRVIVEDNGVGFQPEVVARERSGGRQLGLVGMGERAKLAGGTVVVESEPGMGTTIFLRIPLPSEREGATDG